MVTVTYHPSLYSTSVQEFTVTAINANELSANVKVTVTSDGNVEFLEVGTIRFVKVNADYSAEIHGTWEGHINSGQDTYGDGLQHRWEFKADGTYVYYIKAGDNWVPSANTLNEYFVAGNLLCMRWINAGTEYREWWEVESVENGEMKWKALRQNADGTTFTSTFKMRK